MARVEAVCISDSKGERKRTIEQADFRENHGITGDAHAGTWHRQVSVLSAEDIEAVRERLPDVRPGDSAENVVISGLDLARLGLGSRLKLGGNVVLNITQIGKAHHTPSGVGQLSILPRVGLFARVATGGRVRPGDDAEVLEAVPRDRLQAVVLTISDRCSRGESQDTAGPAVARALTESLDAHVYGNEVLPDDQDAIAGRLKHYCHGHSIDMVFTVGGTGFSPRDVTPEATREVLERFTPGLDETMRAASGAETPHAMLSRGVSGIRGATLIVNLPGSQRAAVENLQAILPALAHGLAKLRGDPADCGR